MQTNSQRRARACDFCGESVAPLYPAVTSEAVAAGEEQKRLVCHTCRSLGHGRPIVAASKSVARHQEQLNLDNVNGNEDGKQPKVAATVVRSHAKQAKAK